MATFGGGLGKPAGPQAVTLTHIAVLALITYNLLHEVNFLGNNKSSVSFTYIIIVGFVSFILAAIFFVFAQFLAEKLNILIISILFLILVMLIGIIFDIIGTSATAANEKTFHPRASKRVAGARESVYILRNADKVANISNDVVGDIAGTVSGAIGISLVFQIETFYPGVNIFIATMIITAAIAAVTVSGKAFGKKIALSKSNEIIFLVGKMIAYTENILGVKILARKRHR